MSQTSVSQLASPVAVVSPQFLAKHPVDLIMVKKVMTLSDGNYGVTDVNGNIMFKIKGKRMSLRDRHVLLDARGNPILSFQEKIQLLRIRRRWQVYRGGSSNSKDLLFSVQPSSIFQFKSSLDVFLAANKKKDACDFKVKGSWFGRSCTIYALDSTTILAKIYNKPSVQSVLLGKQTFSVTVYPSVDYAFIVTLVAILSRYLQE